MAISMSSISKQIRGVSYKPNDLHNQIDDNSIILLRANNINDGTINFDDVVFVDKSRVKSEQILKKGDILICASNGSKRLVGKAAQVNFDKECTFGAFCKVVRPSSDYADLLGVYFQSKTYRKYISNASLGANINNIRNEDINRIKLPNSKKSDQQKLIKLVANCINRLNKRKKQIVLLDILIKSRFVEMFGNQKTNSKAWKQDKLSNLLSIERGGSPRPIDTYITESEDGVNWIKISDAEQGSIYITKAKQKILKTGIKKSRHVKSGDFLLSNSMSFGRPYILKIDGYIHDGWLVLRDINGLFNKLYLYSALSSDYSYSQFCNAAAGAVVNNLNKDIVGKLVIAIPPKEVQNQFAEFVNQVNKSKFVKL